MLEVPSQFYVEDTPFNEKQAIAKEIDLQKRKENPEFKGAFHDKKFENAVKGKKMSDIAYRKAKEKEKQKLKRAKGSGRNKR